MPRSKYLLAAALLLACVELRPPPSFAGDPASSATEPAAAGETKPAKVDADRFGVGWLERDGVFESYNERVRFRRPPGWELLDDDVVALAHPGAGSGLYDPEADIAIYFILERHVEQPQDSDRGLRREITLAWLLGLGASSPEPAMTATFAGTQLVFDAVSGGRNGDEYLYAVHFVEDDALQIVVSYPRAGDREQLRERIRGALVQVELMTRSEAEAVRAELAHGPDTQNHVGQTWSLRRGVYRHFAHDLVWTSPGRDWVIHVGRVAERFGENATLVLQNRMEGLVAQLSVYDDPQIAEADGAAWHEAAVASFVANGANLALIDAVLLETRVGAGLVEAGMDLPRWVDLRLGYSVEVPPGYRLGAAQRLGVDEDIEVRLWGTADGRAAFGLLTQAWASTGWTKEDLVADNEAFFVDLWGPPANARAGSLDGEGGRRLHWAGSRPRDLLIVNRDHTVYMLMVEGNDPELFERARESFAFVD